MNNSQNTAILFDDSSKELLGDGISQTLEQYESLLLDLFDKLREAGMALTIEQYELLRQAIDKGYGLGGWEDLKRVCRLLWVKPCHNYDIDIFERTFENYIQQHYSQRPRETTPKSSEKTVDTSPAKLSSNLPQIPPRKWQSPSTQEINW